MDAYSISSRGALQTGASALIAFSKGIQAPAHNIANVSTDGFKPVSAVYADRPNLSGVKLDAITRDGVPLSGDASQVPGNLDKPSGTELAKEVPSMMLTQRSFQANAQTVRVVDEMLGSILDIIG